MAARAVAGSEFKAVRANRRMLALLVAVGLLAGCGSSGSEDATGNDSTTSEADRSTTTERETTTTTEATSTTARETTTTTVPKTGYSGAPVRVELDGWAYRFELRPEAYDLVDLVQFEKSITSSPPGEARLQVTLREPDPFEIQEGTEVGVVTGDTPGRDAPPIKARAAYLWFDDERDWTDGLPSGHGCYQGRTEIDGQMQSGLVCDLQSAYTETVDLPETVADAFVAGTAAPPILVVGFTIDPIDESSWGLCRAMFHPDGRVDYSADTVGTDCSTAPLG
jgi:uncharacterized protein YceK